MSKLTLKLNAYAVLTDGPELKFQFPDSDLCASGKTTVPTCGNPQTVLPRKVIGEIKRDGDDIELTLELEPDLDPLPAS